MAVATQATVTELTALFERVRTERGRLLVELLEESPLLVVFLRHAGCTFCREALSDIALERQRIEAAGTKIVLVHMGDRPGIEQVIRKYGLGELEVICDASRELYRAFGLKRGGLRQLLGPRVIWRGFLAGILHGHGASVPTADYTQMPGVFYLERGALVRRFRHRTAADRPSYAGLVAGKREDS